MTQNIFIQYLVWHFYGEPKEILRGWKNFLYFGLDFFSIPLLIKTFLSPWRGYRESYGRGFDIKRIFEAFVFNVLIARLIGAAIRIITIVFGIAFELFISLTGLIVLLIWLLLPST